MTEQNKPKGERLRYVLCPKCRRETVTKVDQRENERELFCTNCQYRWKVQGYWS